MSAYAQDQRNYLRWQRTALRSTFNAVRDLSDIEFKNRYRITKAAFLFLCDELERVPLKKTQQISVQEKVLTALFFFANGSYRRPIGVAKFLSQKMTGVYINEVTEALIHPEILHKYISFPTTQAARQVISHKFYTKYGIPGVVGCIDGSHFKIFVPPRSEEHIYYCRKHYHSLNVQMVCDSDCRIINVCPKFGGQNHNAFVWENSSINAYMQNLHQQGEICWLLGDSEYPQRPWLMTPILEVQPDSPEANYNQKHKVARVLIENTFGRLKNKWRCLSKDRVLHYKPIKCSKIVLACCVLYNLALDFSGSEVDYDGEDIFLEGTELSPVYREQNSNDLVRGRIIRDQLVQRINN